MFHTCLDSSFFLPRLQYTRCRRRLLLARKCAFVVLPAPLGGLVRICSRCLVTLDGPIEGLESSKALSAQFHGLSLWRGSQEGSRSPVRHGFVYDDVYSFTLNHQTAPKSSGEETYHSRVLSGDIST